MRTKPTPAAQRNPRVGRCRFPQALIAPAAALDDVALRHKSRLLAILLLTLIALFSLVDITRILTSPGYQPPWYGYVLFGGAYALNRTGYYRLAAGLAIAVFPLIIFTFIVHSPVYGLSRTVQYLVLSLFLASIFVSWRELAMLAAINSAGLLLLPILLPVAVPTYIPLVTPVAVNMIGAALALIYMRHRDQVERDRQAELHTGEERYRVISELVSDYAFAYQVAPDGSALLEWITDAVTRITGYTWEELRAFEPWGAMVHPADCAIADRRRQRLLAGQFDVSEYRIIAKDGRTLWMRLYGRPVWDGAERRVVRVFGAVQDITQIKQLEQQLNQAQKMEAIGRLAGGIAHDFNNLLTVVLGNAELLLAARTDGNALRQDAEQIQQAAGRATALTRQLLAFSRQQVLEPRHLDLNTVVADMGQLLRRLIGEDIELVIRPAPELGSVHADPGQLEQVIMNLAINARDAMPTGGTLMIATANLDMHDASVREHIGAERGPYIMLTISDTGVGMDAATRAHIFEPFYTTKAAGEGTGLGLATVHGIVTQSGGHIRVNSEPGRGTTFTIYLPRVDAAEEPSSADGPPAEASSGDATILLVEDEPLLRDLAGRVLRRYGYYVLEAEDGPTALRVAAAYPGPIHLLLTDVIMPGGMSGRQLAEQLVAQRPAIKVLYMSGYSDTVMTRSTCDPGQAFVQKPFMPDVLVRKVGEIVQG